MTDAAYRQGREEAYEEILEELRGLSATKVTGISPQTTIQSMEHIHAGAAAALETAVEVIERKA